MSNILTYYATLKQIPTSSDDKKSKNNKTNNNKSKQNGNKQNNNNNNKTTGNRRSRGGKKKANNAMVLKTPKGTKDYSGIEMKVRESVMERIRKVFRKHGGTGLETPVFELKSVLTGKYGEDSKLIYDLADQGGEICALRYDLTVPFARFLATQDSFIQLKRYSIGRVYRRDNPVMTKGRYREFYQCDFDIAGHYDGMVADAEVLKICCEALEAVDLGVDFVIKLNHRSLLDGIFEVCGVPKSKFREICSAVDKLDKLPWEEVKKEMTQTKGLKTEIADKIGKYVLLKDQPKKLLSYLLDEQDQSSSSSSSSPSSSDLSVQGTLSKEEKQALASSKLGKKGFNDLKLLFDYLDAYGISDRISFDLSLARGLDYYTGLIFEAILVDNKLELGSISGGGRYDNLVKLFKRKGVGVPAVGFSLGIERIFSIILNREKEKNKNKKQKSSDTLVLVANFPSKNKNICLERMKLVSQLWKQDIPAEIFSKRNPKLKQTLTYAEKFGIPFVVFVGDEELSTDTLTVKSMNRPENDPEKQKKIPRSELKQFIEKEKKYY